MAAETKSKSKVLGFLPDDTPPWGMMLSLGFQQFLTMFPATVLVAILTKFDVGMTLLTSGLGTIIALLVTKRKIPMYYGSSFSYIAVIITVMNKYAGGCFNDPNTVLLRGRRADRAGRHHPDGGIRNPDRPADHAHRQGCSGQGPASHRHRLDGHRHRRGSGRRSARQWPARIGWSPSSPWSPPSCSPSIFRGRVSGACCRFCSARLSDTSSAFHSAWWITASSPKRPGCACRP